MAGNTLTDDATDPCDVALQLLSFPEIFVGSSAEKFSSARFEKTLAHRRLVQTLQVIEFALIDGKLRIGERMAPRGIVTEPLASDADGSA